MEMLLLPVILTRLLDHPQRSQPLNQKSHSLSAFPYLRSLGITSPHFIEGGFPTGASVEESAWQYRRCKRHRFDPWVGKISWRRKWKPTPVFLPGKFHGQRSLVGYSLWGHQESDTTEHRAHDFIEKSAQQKKLIQNTW